LPAAFLGLLFGGFIKAQLFNPVWVAFALVLGGFIILWAERSQARAPEKIRIASVDDVGPMDALKIGFAQAVALIPGTSRSGATIIGGMFFGFSRQAATEFSFFLQYQPFLQQQPIALPGSGMPCMSRTLGSFLLAQSRRLSWPCWLFVGCSGLFQPIALMALPITELVLAFLF
jgi:Uncharacterized bacitracin resistance protein